MENLSQINMLAKSMNAPKASQNTIGKNGSFWLPPEVKSKFSMLEAKAPRETSKNLKTDSSQNPRPESQSATVKQRNAMVEAQSKTASMAKKLVHTKVKTNPIQQPSRQTTVIKGRPSQITPVKAESGKNPLIPHVKGFVQNLKNSKEVPNLRTVALDENIDPDSHNKQKNKNRRSDGAKYALISEEMSGTEKVLSFSLGDESSVASHKKSVMPKTPLDVTRQAIGAKISYINKFNKKVVRFAIDLPNGGKFGVRLEKNGQDLSLSLICLNNDSKQFLSSVGKDLFSNVEGLQVNIYDSYKEMDLSREQVA